MKLGMIGSGFMGMTHTFGFATAERVFDLPVSIELELIADATVPLAERARHRLGFSRSTANWRDIIEDPDIEIVDICAPNALHRTIAETAMAAGKHVYCEKPLAPTSDDANAMAVMAKASGVVTQVGFNYLANPMISLARDMIESGDLREIRSFRGVHAEDYMKDAQSPYTWRHDQPGGGVLADLGSHILATAEHLLGSISDVMGDLDSVITERPGPNGPQQVAVDDVARAFLRFENGASGSIEANWLATGQKMQHEFEIYGSKGSLKFSQERFNELQYFSTKDADGRAGFRTILAGPDHPPYGDFCVAGGHQLGFNDLKAIEIKGFLDAIAGTKPEPFGFSKGARIQRLVDMIQASAEQSSWIKVA